MSFQQGFEDVTRDARLLGIELLRQPRGVGGGQRAEGEGGGRSGCRSRLAGSRADRVGRPRTSRNAPGGSRFSVPAARSIPCHRAPTKRLISGAGPFSTRSSTTAPWKTPAASRSRSSSSTRKTKSCSTGTEPVNWPSSARGPTARPLPIMSCRASPTIRSTTSLPRRRHSSRSTGSTST